MVVGGRVVGGTGVEGDTSVERGGVMGGGTSVKGGGVTVSELHWACGPARGS